MVEPKDFSHRQTFPGVENNLFDRILHFTEKAENIPASLFTLILMLLAISIGRSNLALTLIMFAFFLFDFLLIKSLSIARLSYGPKKPPVLELAILRTVVAFIFIGYQYMLFLQVVGTILVIYGFWIEPHRIKVTIQEYKSKEISPGNSIRILHLGDLHIERFSNRERDLLQLIEKNHPDLILFSGDVLNLSYLDDAQAWQDAREVIKHWQALYGVYFVYGSPAVDIRNNMKDLLTGLPIHCLNNEQVTINHNGDSIDLIGISCSHKPFIDTPIFHSTFVDNPGHLKILLYHSPDLAPEAAKTGIHLQFSGHTHGGQVCLPFFGALVTGSLYGKIFDSGRKQLNNLTLYITRGVGMEGGGAPRVRFLCPPEIVLWEISSNR